MTSPCLQGGVGSGYDTHSMIVFSIQRYALLALASAALFGISTPLAKLLLGHATPLVLAGLLYLGSGLGLLIVWLAQRGIRRGRSGAEAERRVPLRGRDMPWLAGAVVAGGILAPVALLWGVSGMQASGASLLLNAEAVLTILVAAAIFREHVGARVWVAAMVMLAGGLLLAWEPGAAIAVSPRALAVLAACLLWALDNNLTRNIAASNPVAIAMVKGLAAGAVNLGLGLANAAPPAAEFVASALALGAASYGASLVLFIMALRHLGSARTGAHFATSPFIGAAVAIGLLEEPFTGRLAASLAMMVAATWLLLTETHGHHHTHERVGHSHPHAHDEHHAHVHDGGEEPEPHAHWHVHDPITHSHPHLPDLHHRHPH